jgi:hypothetical protein
MRLLTQEEVSILPAGTEVWVIWAWGWMPKRYVIRHRGGFACAVCEETPQKVAGVLGMVGNTVFDDRVWIAEKTIPVHREQVAVCMA